MKLTFWGVRGSLPMPLTYDIVQKKIKTVMRLARPSDLLSEEAIEKFLDSLPFSISGTYGGNTTCVEIRTDDDTVFIIDAGSGIRPLGSRLFAEERFRGKGIINLFITHSHWDHIMGLLFFTPIYIPGNLIRFYSAFPDIEQRLRYQQVDTHFPAGFDSHMLAKKEFYDLSEKEPSIIEGVKVSSKELNHPGKSYAYKFEQNGKNIIFASDAEFNLDNMDGVAEYVEFFRGADVLIFDTQYTLAESFQKIDWGHSSAQMATDIAIKSEVKKLILFHHDNSYDDEKMDAVALQAAQYREMAAPGSQLKIMPAYEGLEMVL